MLRPSLLYQVDKSVQGDELAYVFGLPLAPTAVRPGRHFTFDEKRLSEQVITFWTNFAKTGYATPRHALRLARSFHPRCAVTPFHPEGFISVSLCRNPNVPRTQARLYWPEYSSREMPYLNISK